MLLALRGREKEALPNGSHVGFYKDALYADHRIARLLTGAFRTTFSGHGARCTSSLRRATGAGSVVEQGICCARSRRRCRPARLVLWPYDRFPFGMSLDYERKFTHYVPGERDAGPGRRRATDPRDRLVTCRPWRSRTAAIEWRRGGVAVLTAILCCTPVARAQDVTEPSLKAAFIYNFAKFTEWPADVLPGTAPFSACVLGDAPLATRSSEPSRGAWSAGHGITVSQVSSTGRCGRATSCICRA